MLPGTPIEMAPAPVHRLPLSPDPALSPRVQSNSPLLLTPDSTLGRTRRAGRSSANPRPILPPRPPNPAVPPFAPRHPSCSGALRRGPPERVAPFRDGTPPGTPLTHPTPALPASIVPPHGAR